MECGITAVGTCSEYDGNMLLAIELFFIGLLALAGLAIAWVSGIVVYKLFKGQR
ncbi:TRAP transporter small membrane protein [Aurantimicrobium minutum]|uniref:TRAP transporter small membrane protein n=1 Tax=Aurantimicrobium minutum TaxID=708131 RepID=A0A173LXL8_9MICO|nr:TRAP transporter small membrane protein [Aurantimicrobium minutum]